MRDPPVPKGHGPPARTVVAAGRIRGNARTIRALTTFDVASGPEPICAGPESALATGPERHPFALSRSPMAKLSKSKNGDHYVLVGRYDEKLHRQILDRIPKTHRQYRPTARLWRIWAPYDQTVRDLIAPPEKGAPCSG